MPTEADLEEAKHLLRLAALVKIEPTFKVVDEMLSLVWRLPRSVDNEHLANGLLDLRLLLQLAETSTKEEGGDHGG